MADFGFQCFSNSGRYQINAETIGRNLRAKGTVNVNGSWERVPSQTNGRIATISYNNGTAPILALRFSSDFSASETNPPVVGLLRTARSGNNYTFTIIVSRQSAPVPQNVDYYIFDVPVASGGWGLETYDASGNLVYTTGLPLLNIASAFNPMQSPAATGTVTFTGSTSKKYAAVCTAIIDEDTQWEQLTNLQWFTVYRGNMGGAWNFLGGMKLAGVQYMGGTLNGQVDPITGDGDTGEGAWPYCNTLVIDVTGL